MKEILDSKFVWNTISTVIGLHDKVKGTSYAWYNGNWWPRNKIRLRPSWRQYVTNYSGDTLFLMDVTWQFTWFFMKSDSEPKWTSVSPWGTSNMKIDKGFCLDKISLSFLSLYLSFSLSVCPSVRVCVSVSVSLSLFFDICQYNWSQG